VSDGAAGAPGAAPAAAPAATQQGAPPAATQVKPKANEPPAWSEKDDAELFERVQKAPWARVKVNGRDEPIKSKDDMMRVITDAQRGRGANRVVEESKKAAEEGKRAAEKATRLEEALERARRGDAKALRELGLVPDDERQRAEREFSQLPPEVQEVLRQNYELSERLTAKERAEQERAQQEELTIKERKKKEVLDRARSVLPELMSDIREEFADVDLPDVLQVMETLRSEGSRLGVDYDVQHIKLMVEQLREGGINNRIKQMKPEAAARNLAPMLAGMKANELKAALGEHFVPIAKAISRAYIAAVKGERNKPQQQQQSREEEAPKQRTPLSPFRFR
jgi:hypothetical protein